MKTYVVLLRGVNVSGKNLIKMALLKQVVTAAGFTDVTTYIQSGNIVLKSRNTASQIEKDLALLISTHFNCEVAVFCLDVSDLETALKNNPFPTDAPPNKVFITFLKETPSPDLIQQLQTIDFKGEVFKVRDKVLYFYLPEGMEASKMSNNFFERKLKVIATGRNLNTIKKLMELTASSADVKIQKK